MSQGIFSIYHFTKIRDSNFETFVNRIPACERITICLDLEDSIIDFFNATNSSNKKKEYRSLLYSFFFNYDPIRRFGLRVNTLKTTEFKKDIELLAGLKDHFSFNSIFLPKCKNVNDLNNSIEKFTKHNIQVNDFIPIIECAEGFKNINEIVHSEYKDKIKMIAFGHCDFNLDKNIFPFKHQDDKKYWSWIDNFYEALKDTKIGFINSPYLKLDYSPGFLNNLNEFKRYNFAEKGQITLNCEQLHLCLSHARKYIETGIRNLSEHNQSKIIFAKYLLSSFREDYDLKKGFSIRKNFSELISPQEYFAAKKFMGTNF